MLTHPTLDQLHAMGFYGMAKAFQEMNAKPEADALSHAEWLALLLDHEARLRQDSASPVAFATPVCAITRFLKTSTTAHNAGLTGV